MRLPSLLLAAALLATAGLATSRAESVTAALHGDAQRPAAAHWLRSELYFATGLADAPQPAVSDEQWRAFLDREVTPRFPDGLTVFDATGQWRNRTTNTIGRLRTKVLVILHDDSPEGHAAIDAIRLAWKTATHHQSVILATQTVEVSF